MKKLNVLYTFCSCLLLMLFVCGGMQNAHAQCTPDAESISEFDLSYQVVNEASVTRVQFFLDYVGASDIGAYGFQLQVYLTGNISGVSAVNYSLSSSWLFTCSSTSASANYDSGTHKVTFNAVRVDCEGREGEGFIGEIIITRSSGSESAVQSLNGGILLVENIDAC